MTFFEWLKRRFAGFKFLFSVEFEVLLATILMGSGIVLFIVGIFTHDFLTTIGAVIPGVPGYLVYLHFCYRVREC